jgi:hypothetical protein
MISRKILVFEDIVIGLIEEFTTGPVPVLYVIQLGKWLHGTVLLS